MARYPTTPHRSSDLVEAARVLAGLDPDGTAFQYAPDGRTVTDRLTRDGLDRRARAVAAALQAAGVAPGDRVLLLTGPGPEFVAGLYGCLYAGVCAVPCPPPRAGRRRDRLASVAADARPAAVLATGGADPGLDVPVLLIEDAADTGSWRPCPVRPDTPALLQYTSGSTSTPKGVMITHENLVANIEMILGPACLDTLEAPLSMVSWLPVHHDMGLVGCLLTPLFSGGTATLMPPEAFLQDPACWLRLIGESEIPVSSAVPNFALDMCVDRTSPEQLADLRLDHWRRLVCGAEPVRAASVERFVRHLRPLGFRPEALLPAYGLAEATLLVTVDGRGPRTLRADPAGLERGRLTPVPTGGGIELVSCGAPPAGCHLAIVDTEGGRCPDGVVGEIWVSGEHVTQGYWGGAPSPHSTMKDDVERRAWLRTGDLGVVRDGALYVTGRRKDLIIVDGRNLHPHDIELTAGRDAPMARPGLSAAFSVPVDGVERLVVVRALDPRIRADDTEALNGAAERVRRAVIEEHDVEPHAVVLVRAREIELTTSGKVRRQEMRRRHLAGELRGVHVHTAAERAGGRSPDLRTLLGLAAGSRRGAVEAWLRERAAALANAQAWEIDPDLPLPASGLDSQRVARLRAEILDATGFAVRADVDSLRALVDAVVAGLDGPSADDAPDTPSLVPAPDERHEPFPLTDLQHAYLVGRGPGQEYGGVAAHAYLEVDADDLDLGRLEAAWRRLVARHDMMRAVVTADDRQRTPEPAAAEPGGFDRFDLRGIPPEEVRAALDHEVPSPYEGPMHRIAVSRLPDGHVRLHLSVDLLVADLWSLYVLSQECRRLYEDPGSDLPELDLGFRDWVIAERSPRPEDVAYWRDRMPTLPPGPQLPVLPWRPGEPARFTRREHRIDSAEWARLVNLAQAHGVTPSTALLAAYSTVLGVWSRSPRFAVNVTLFNRPDAHPGIAGVVGDFTSVDPLEVDCAAPGRFAEHALNVQRRLWQDLEHSSYSGLQVMRDLARRDGVQGRAILPCVFTSGLGVGVGDGEPPFAWLGHAVHGISQTPQVLLDHQVFEDGGGALLIWDAAGDYFAPGVLDDMFAAYRLLLEELAAGRSRWDGPPSVPVPAHQAETRARVNDTGGPVPAGTLPDAVFARAAERPGATAVIAPDRTLAYGELADRAESLAADLSAAGIGRGDVVAVAMPKGWRQVVAVLAAARIGAIYLPVDPGLPEERQRWLVDSAGAALVLHEVPDEPGPARGPRPALGDARPRPEDVAYILYTSGSTGTPKGVAVGHRAALNTCADIVERFAIGPDDRVLGVSSLSFDLSVFDTFGILGAGATLVLPDPGRRADPAHWTDLADKYGVTVWNSVPALMELVVDHVERGGSPRTLPLRRVLLSGDWIPLSLPDRLRALAPGAQVVSLGGATEAGIWSIAYPIERVDPAWESIPYGRPLRNQWFEVLNEQLEPCPTWVTGELFIGGTSLADGYWRDPERTGARFITRPGSEHRLYRTGDLGRYLPDSTIQFLGRRDHQVKIGGHRIEPGEIEHTLRTGPGVGEAVVIAHGERHRRRLAAFVTRAAAAPALPGEDELDLLKGDLDGVLIDPAERLEFAAGRPGLRTLPANGAITLPEVGTAPRRSSHRRFTSAPVALEALSRVLEGLRDGERHAYGSAGGLYPVQLYLDVADDGVAGLPGGAYHYGPDGHRLVPLSHDVLPGRPGFTSVNAGLAADAPFAIYLVAQSRAIRPLYGDLWRDFSLIETGLIAQLLESSAPAAGLGLCQVGHPRFSADLRARFDLDDGHEPLHALVGGVPDTTPAAQGPTRAGLRRLLAERLPPAMVPPTIVVLDRLPLTSNGKVDRRELERLAGETGTADETLVPPATDLERAIAAEVAGELGRHRISVTDGFFAMGLDSIMAARICARLRARLADAHLPGADLPLSLMFEAPSVRELAARLDAGAYSAAATGVDLSRATPARSAARAGECPRPLPSTKE
ncbi:non-ribosomal peptide synthetase [Actinomadura soli]|nr:non-ribosomal peptide synthetase [Actinomadura soli]